MRYFLRYLVSLFLQIAHALQNDSTPPDRKLSEDGNEPTYDPIAASDGKATFALPLVLRQQRHIMGRAHIIAASEPQLPTQEKLRIQEEMEAVLQALK